MWRRLFSERRNNREIEEEFEHHFAIEIAHLMERGLTREAAEFEARRMFGNRALVAEVTRETWGFARLGRLAQDARYAMRILFRSPGFTAATVLSLALGIGASTAVFSIVDTIFLRPLPYANSEQLAFVAIRFSGANLSFLPSPDYVAWRHDNHTFQQLAATQFSGGTTMVLGGTDPAEVHAARVSFNFLSTFAITPALGRVFKPEEELLNGPRAVLLTNGFWRGHFQAKRDVIGSTIQLDGQPYAIVGVLPASFIFPMDVKIDVLTTLPVSPTASHRDRSMSLWAAFGRLKPGVTLHQARADLATLFAASKADAPMMFRSDTSLMIESLQQHRAGDAHTLLLILAGAVACLLLIACANVANLLLARWSARSRELAVRAAIGASRGRLVRQLFTETALLTAFGWLFGMLLVTAILRGFVRYAAGELPRLAEVAPDARVLAIALVVSAVTVLIFGGLPALRAGRVDIQCVLQQVAQRSLAGGHRLLRRGLVAAEVALSIILLSGAALLLQTLWHMRNDRLGFQPEHIVTVSVPLRGMRLDHSGRDALANDLLSDLRRMPGTEAAALTECTPLSGGSMGGTFSRSDRPMPEAFHRGDNIAMCGVGPDYFKAAGMRLLKGRFITREDFQRPGTVTLINEAAARAYFPGEEPIGKQIGGQLGQWKTVIGVVADTKNRDLNQPATPQMFINDTELGGDYSDLLLIVKSLTDERALASGFRAELRERHPGLFAKFQTLDEAIGERTASPRFNSLLLTGFAVVALLMAIVGVYGVLAFSVTRRTHEIGIRMALGAERRGVLALVMREGALLVAAGTVFGLIGALILTRFLKTLLYGVTATDPATYVAVVIGLGVAAVAASWLPARRAAAVDPMVALRHE